MGRLSLDVEERKVLDWPNILHSGFPGGLNNDEHVRFSSNATQMLFRHYKSTLWTPPHDCFWAQHCFSSGGVKKQLYPEEMRHQKKGFPMRVYTSLQAQSALSYLSASQKSHIKKEKTNRGEEEQEKEMEVQKWNKLKTSFRGMRFWNGCFKLCDFLFFISPQVCLLNQALEHRLVTAFQISVRKAYKTKKKKKMKMNPCLEYMDSTKECKLNWV